MSDKLYVAPSPHQHSGEKSSRIMLDVILALVPAFILSVVVFGLPALVVTVVAILSCMIFEALIQRFLVKGEPTLGNYSAMLTGLLLGFNLPASIPLWIVIIGALVSVGVAKMSFGGLGKNPFNPALVGRVFLLIAYPVQMTSFPTVGVDSLSGATPLAAMKMGGVGVVEQLPFMDMLLGGISGSLGEVSALLLLLGGCYLLYRKVISWHIPVAMLGMMALVALIVALGSGYGGRESLLFMALQLVAGGAILGAVYMATDYVTSPMTHKGMLIYGAAIGLITMFIRLWGAYPEGVSFAILIMNACVPLINKYVKPQRFGVKK